MARNGHSLRLSAADIAEREKRLKAANREWEPVPGHPGWRQRKVSQKSADRRKSIELADGRRSEPTPHIPLHGAHNALADAPRSPLTELATKPRKSTPGNPKTVKKPVASESAILKACLSLLATHPKVAFAYRQNTGAMQNPAGQFVKFGFRGQSDIVGMLRAGRFFACEVKKPGKFPTAEQHAFLAAVNEGGGLGIWCDSLERLIELLK